MPAAVVRSDINARYLGVEVVAIRAAALGLPPPFFLSGIHRLLLLLRLHDYSLPLLRTLFLLLLTLLFSANWRSVSLHTLSEGTPSELVYMRGRLCRSLRAGWCVACVASGRSRNRACRSSSLENQPTLRKDAPRPFRPVLSLTTLYPHTHGPKSRPARGVPTTYRQPKHRLQDPFSTSIPRQTGEARGVIFARQHPNKAIQPPSMMQGTRISHRFSASGTTHPPPPRRHLPTSQNTQKEEGLRTT